MIIFLISKYSSLSSLIACISLPIYLFFQGENPEVSYADRNGKYQGQTGITLAKAK